MRKAGALLLFLLVVGAVAFLGSTFTASSVGTWYEQLNKPAWTPPSAVFGPVWTFLYICMAVAAWLVWQREPGVPATPAISLWLLQLALNLAWSVLFFGLRMPSLAAVEIILLWGAIMATTIAFFREARLAGWLMVPYWLWVTYAATLNIGIWFLN